ncbi:hypothetical protein jhhlp_002806 [Lomentospora prolificans]|uniref:Clr5 domain-containing protein n=1 Tax=Lomentospora prolificans TaxID=41688 RepID=A0A2N3NF43_9PEZI|nr:hypothetical protein jhhlp_002806 [Lomentospora prolificans]
MFNHSPSKLHGGLGSRHGDDPSIGGGGLGLGIANPNQQQHQYHFQQRLQQFQLQHQQDPAQDQAHPSNHQPIFPAHFSFASPPAQDASPMHNLPSNVAHSQAQNPAHGQDVDMGDAHQPEASVTNLIAQFENRSAKPPKPAKPSHVAAFNRANNALRVTSPTGEQFTSSSLRVRSGSIGRPPPVRFGSMGHQGHTGMRVASPITSQSVEAYGNRAAARSNSRAAATPTSPYTTIANSMSMPAPLRRQASSADAMQTDNMQNENFMNTGTMSPGTTGNMDGNHPSPFSFVSNGGRIVRSMQGHMMDTFGNMGGSMASPIVGTPTSPFGNIDYSAPRVVSPIQSPSIDPYGDIGALANLGGNNGTHSHFDAMSSADRVSSPMQTAGMSALDLGLDTKQTAQFVNSPTDAFQNIDPFLSMNSVASHQHSQVSFADMGSTQSTDPFAGLGLLIKQEPNVDSGHHFDGLSPGSRSASTVHAPMNFANQGYFQPQALSSHTQTQQDTQQQQQHQQQRPPPPPAKKSFLSRNQQDVGGTQSTPGFNMWRPPVPSTPKPVISHSQQPSKSSITSTTPNKSAAFLAQSRAELRIQTDHQPSIPQQQQPFSASMSITSPNSVILPSSVDTTVHNPSVASPNPPPLPARPSQQGSRPSREQVPAEAWESMKSIIRQLYLEERKPLKEVIQVMADRHGFQATPKMYKTRFSQWGFVKNNTEEEVKKLLSMKFQRDAEGKVSEFVRNGRVINLGTYLKRKGVTEYDLVDFETPADLPSYVRCRTPTPPPAPGYLRSPDLLRAQETVVGNMRKAFLHCRQSELDTKTTVGWTAVMVWGACSSELLYEANKRVETGDAGQGVDLIEAFKQLEVDLQKLSPQGIKEVLMGMVHRDPGMMTALSKYLAAYSSTNYERLHPLRQIFTTLYEVQQKHGPMMLSDLVWGCIPTLADELESIYGRRHPYVARTWIDLSMFYRHTNGERLQNLITEYQPLRRSIESKEGTHSVEDFAFRYTMLQLTNAANPQSSVIKTETLALWQALKDAGRASLTRSSDGNTYCVHDAIKVTPWIKRCQETYATVAELLQRYAGVNAVFYFEEDMHTMEHVPDAASAWAAAMEFTQHNGGRVI